MNGDLDNTLDWTENEITCIVADLSNYKIKDQHEVIYDDKKKHEVIYILS